MTPRAIIVVGVRYQKIAGRQKRSHPLDRHGCGQEPAPPETPYRLAMLIKPLIGAPAGRPRLMPRSGTTPVPNRLQDASVRLAGKHALHLIHVAGSDNLE